jgi:hypothetical protein
MRSARRKLRALVRSRRSKRRASAHRANAALATAVATAVATAFAAYQLCAKKTHDSNVAVAATNAATSLATAFDVTPLRLGDRLRLEWLAAMGDADTRLLGECARVLGDAIAIATEERIGDRIRDRIRLASAEAYSLLQAVSRTTASSAEAGWRSPTASVAFLSFAR